jgi:hypothetical protein
MVEDVAVAKGRGRESILVTNTPENWNRNGANRTR